MSSTDPDPWCQEADGQYEPPTAPEVIVVQADVSEDTESEG